MIARVVINSPLPQLDRLFDYEVPAELETLVSSGVRVRVQFGRSKSLYEGFIVELVNKSEFEGKLAEIAEVVSSAPVLDQKIYQLVRAVADRQASTASDVLRLAIPDRSVAVEKRWLENQEDRQTANSAKAMLKETAARETAIVAPVTVSEGPSWVLEIILRAKETFERGQSTIIVVPDFRDQQALIDGFMKSDVASKVINFSTSLQKSKRYENFLACLSADESIVIGSRSSIYAPVRNLGQIIVWDDADRSHNEPSSPYSHTREVSLIRQKLEDCNLLLLGHSRSAEVERLLRMSFLRDVTKPFTLPRIANSDSDVRVDSMAWKAIREGLTKGAVLVQVSSKGHATSIFCSSCEKRAQCRTCNGPLWIDERNHTRCRWCNAVNLDYKCPSCLSTKLKQGSAGATRTAAEFGRAFPGTKVFEFTGEERSSSIKPGNFIVVATPGAEPRVEGGYAAVIILDANRALNQDSLRSTEDAVRQWANAIALAGVNARSVIVGVTGVLASKFALWAQAEIAAHEYSTRAELRFPPAIRLASVGTSKELIQVVVAELGTESGFEILGPMPITQNGIQSEWRVLVKYEYSDGSRLAELLRSVSLKLSAGQQRFSARSGRAMRPIRIKMDDVEVI